MKNLNGITKLLAIILLISTASCTLEDAEEGLQGLQGIQGIPGLQGLQGPPGEDGALNLIDSGWMDQEFNSDNDPRLKTMLVNDPNLNEDFFTNSGIVLGFFRETENVTNNLPFINGEFGIIRSFSTTAYPERGEVKFTLTTTDGSNLTDKEINGNDASFTPQYRYVMVPGGIDTSGISSSNFQDMDFEEIMESLNLPY